jgi:hypothetical protein
MATTIAPDSLKLVLDTDILTDWRYQRSHATQAVRDYLALFNVYPQLTAMTVFEARFGIENKAVKSGGFSVDTSLLTSRFCIWQSGSHDNSKLAHPALQPTY